MVVIVTQTTWFKEWLRGFIVRQAEDYVNGRLSIGRLDGNLFLGVELTDVAITQSGRTVVSVKDLGLDYNFVSFVRGHAVLDSIRVTQPLIFVERTADGWNLINLVKARTPDPDEPKNRPDIEIGEIGISDGTLLLDGSVAGTSGIIDAPPRVERLDASVAVTSNADELRVTINHASLRTPDGGIGVNALSGVVRRTENVVTLDNVSLWTEETSLRVSGTVANIEGSSLAVDLSVSSDKFDTEEIGKLVPALRGYRMQPAFELTAKGPAERMQVEVDARDGKAGHVIAALTVDGKAPGRRAAGTVSMEHLNAGPLGKSATFRSDITGQGTIDLMLPEGRLPLRGTYSVVVSSAELEGYRASDVNARGRIDGDLVRVDASAAAYGGRVTAAGTIRARLPLPVDLTGRATNIDLRNLSPALIVPGARSALQFTYHLIGLGPVLSGDVRMEQSTVAGATIAEGTTGTFRVGDGAPEYSAIGQVTRLDAQAAGRAFGFAWLTPDRYQSRISAEFDLTGRGGGRHPLTLDATGTAIDSQMFGATFPRLDFTTSLAGGDARVKAVGQFANLNPAVITDDPRTAGDLTGAVDIDTTIRRYAGDVTVADVDASGRVNVANSRLAEFAIDTGVVDGRFSGREGILNQVAIAGPDVNIQGQGALALNETGASNLTLHIETPALDRIGTIVGQPLKGAAVVDATVTGNASALRAQGTLTGSNIGHGDTRALALDTTFDLTVPELTVADATLKATSLATFVEVGGQMINEVKAETAYAMDTLEFSGTAKEGVRELQAGGSVLIHPDHQEVQVTSLSLRSEMIQWTTTPGSTATIQYGRNRVEMQNVRLVSGDQSIAADGVLGSASEPLRVQAQNVDVAQLDALLLGQQRFSGRLTGNAVVTGQASAPRVAGEFTLSPGAFRTFTFESFGGRVDYQGQGLTVDVRLQQSPQAWLTATGFAPLALFGDGAMQVGGAHVTAAAGEAVALEVASSQIDLGVIEGLTSYVTNVAGTLQANVHVTGSAADPHLDGAIEIAGGAFAVPILGTQYSGLDTQIDLTQEGVTVRRMRILDKAGQPMTIGGTLAMHGRRGGAVDITITSDTFEVVDNDLGRLKLDTDLRLTGEVGAPRLEGSVDIHTGTIDVGEVLKRTLADPYSITTDGPAAVPGIFERLDLKIGLAIPGNLVLNGSDLRPVNAPIDVGDITATVGGIVQIEKLPFDVLRVYGEANTVRGSYTFQGRRFDIERDGRIRFWGGNEIEAYLDLRATRTISGVQTAVRIRGTMRAPELSFSSNPPLEEAEILSLIVFNAPINELGQGQQVSLTQRATALAGGYFASGLANSIGNALRLDEFQIQTSGDDGGGPQLTVGEQIGDNLFFRLRQGFGSGQATELILEYQIKEFLRLQTTAAEAQGGTQRATFRRIERGGIDLIFFFNY